MSELKDIEEIEKTLLIKLCEIFKDSLEDFSTSVDRSLRYLDKIVLSIIMASKQEKSYNPFAEIIEKYVLNILIRKFEKEGYNLLPLGYSADLTLENDQHILSIDIKTANIDNPSDFRGTINVGINQMTHIAKLPLKDKQYLPSPYFVYPTIPPFYSTPGGGRKLILTYGLMFIYPSYRDLIDNIRKDYNSLFEAFNYQVKSTLIPIVVRNFKISDKEAKKILEKKTEKSRYSKDELITESLIRGLFIYGEKDILNALKFLGNEYKIIEDFSSSLKKIIKQLRELDIKPIAIIAISLPNGILKEKYCNRFVSGKDYAKSARYHYENGIFEVIKEETEEVFSRVVFVDLNKNYLNKLKEYFNKIFILEYQLKVL